MFRDIVLKCIPILILFAAGTGLLLYLKARYRKTKVQCIESLRIGISAPLYKDIATDIDSGEKLEVISTTRGRTGDSYYVYRPQNGRGNSYRTRVKGILYFIMILLLLILCLPLVNTGLTGR